MIINLFEILGEFKRFMILSIYLSNRKSNKFGTNLLIYLSWIPANPIGRHILCRPNLRKSRKDKLNLFNNLKEVY